MPTQALFLSFVIYFVLFYHQIYTSRALGQFGQNQVQQLPQLPRVHKAADLEEVTHSGVFPSQGWCAQTSLSAMFLASSSLLLLVL